MTIFLSLLLGFLGFLDAAYLTILHYKNIIPPCSIAHGCETVLNSKFASIGPIPIALLGVVYYLGVLGILGVLLHNKNNKLIASSLLRLCSIGFVISIILVAIQAFVLHAYCQWCLTSEGINVVLFFLAYKISKKK